MPAPTRPPIDPQQFPAAERSRLVQWRNWADQAEQVANTAEQRVAQHLDQLEQRRINMDQLSDQIATLQGAMAANATLMDTQQATIISLRAELEAMTAERDALKLELQIVRVPPSKPPLPGGNPVTPAPPP